MFEYYKGLFAYLHYNSPSYEKERWHIEFYEYFPQ